MLLLSIPSAIFFPFSKMITEKFVLKYTTKKFWNTGLFINTPAKHGGIALYHLLCFIFSIPFSAIYLALHFIKNRTTS
ncbi:colicin E1 immunity protein [Proteus sp. NMG38-2]|nr:colicin E1 immunity protein [Proteus sp. NMG38-2]